MKAAATLERTAFHTSRLLDFASEKELTAQTGHEPDDWPLVALKELLDNALDACEETGTAPEIAVRVDERGIMVEDNGPGLPAAVIEKVLDFTVRVSSREAFVAPDRGAQGNALKTLVAMPFVLDGQSGTVEIEAHGVHHEITFKVDPIRQQPVISHRQEEGFVKIGTRITVHWPNSARSILEDAEERFLQIADDYTWLNPHLSLTVDWFGRSIATRAIAPSWKKWKPSDPTSAHWYQTGHLARLVAAYLAYDEDAGRERTVREFVSEFRGLSGSGKQKKVLEACGLGRAPLSSLSNGDGLDTALIEILLAAMKENTAPVKPEQLGVIGKETLQQRFAAAGCEMESFQYKREAGLRNGLPWIVEVAFAWSPQACEQRLVTGVNWSPGIINPFQTLGHFMSLDSVLSDQRAGAREQVAVFLHVACPRVEYLDRGKSSVILTHAMEPRVIIDAVRGVTAKWAKQRKTEERNRAAQIRRHDALTRRRAISVKDAAYAVMQEAYMKASANNTLPAAARQIMYAARGRIQELTEKKLDDRYFTQTLLPDFMAEHPELTAGWKVVFDARGHLIEPHTRHSVPLGTTEVEVYLRCLGDPRWSDPSASMPAISTRGPSGRYGAVLFIEKEGFSELFEKAKLAEQYDLAIMSTKGVSVTAARRLVDRICAHYDIPLFVLHDFDTAGLMILRTLQCDTRRYQFENVIQVIDLGLRLADAEEWGLESESVHHHQKWSSIRSQLEESGATEEEIRFLAKRRVELNAFTSDKLIQWIEGKLEEHGVRKVIPDDEILVEEYRRQHQSTFLRRHFDELLERSRRHIEDLEVSVDLREEVAHLLKKEPSLAWDDAVAEIAKGENGQHR